MTLDLVRNLDLYWTERFDLSIKGSITISAGTPGLAAALEESNLAAVVERHVANHAGMHSIAGYGSQSLQVVQHEQRKDCAFLAGDL